MKQANLKIRYRKHYNIFLLSFSLVLVVILLNPCKAQVFDIDEPKDGTVYYPGDSLLVGIYIIHNIIWHEDVEIVVKNPDNKVIYNEIFTVSSKENRFSIFTFPKSERGDFKFGEYTITIKCSGEIKSVKIYFSPRFVFKLWSSDKLIKPNESIKVKLFLKNVCSETFHNVTLLFKTESGVFIHAGRGEIWSPVVSWDFKEFKPNDDATLEADIRINNLKDSITFTAEVYGCRENTNVKILLQRDTLVLKPKAESKDEATTITIPFEALAFAILFVFFLIIIGLMFFSDDCLRIFFSSVVIIIAMSITAYLLTGNYIVPILISLILIPIVFVFSLFLE